MRGHDLGGRVIVIFGGAAGIGAATATAARAAGAWVVVGDVSLAARPDRTAGGVPIWYVDVSDERSLRAMRTGLLARYARIDVIVNCAAVIEPGPFATMSEDAIRRQFAVNALGTALVTRTFLPVFLEQSSGHFIHLSSLGGVVPLPNEAVYSATKFAVRGFCLALAEELRGTGVAATVVCPDSTDTAQLWAEAYRDGAPLSFTSRPLPPTAVAHAILRAIRRPRREVCVPRRRGSLAKLLGVWTRTFALVYPMLSAHGNRLRKRLLAQRRASLVQFSAYEEVPS